MKWVDYSKYQGRVGKDKLRRMKADGVVGVCVGSWHGLDANPYVEANLRDARSLGLKTATYIVVNNRGGSWTVQQGRNACGAEWDHLDFVAADVEIRGVTEAILAAALAQIVRLGRRACIYTGNWFWNWWKADLGHAPDFRAWATWLAYYNGKPDLNVPVAWGLGELVGHQYAGSTPAYGTTVDFNVFDPAWFKKEESKLSSKEYEELKSWVQVKVHNAIVARLRHLERRVTALHSDPKPAPPPKPPAPKPEPKTHRCGAEAGRGLWGVAEHLGVPGNLIPGWINQVKALNGWANVANPILHVGMVIRVP